MSPRTNWKAVADQLASRMVSHAYCDYHPASNPGPDCPNCGDRTAYLAYLAAGGYDFTPASPAGRNVLLSELPPPVHRGTLRLVTAEDGTQYTEFTDD